MPASHRSTYATRSSGSGRRPSPTSPDASSPWAGGTTSTPSARSRPTLRWVAGWAHMSWSMAGATRTGHRAESTMAVSIESQKPPASRASVWAVAGAITTASAHRPRSTCRVQAVWASPASGNSSDSTSRPASVAIVSGGMKRAAAAVITGCTSAPALTSRRVRSAAL